MADDRKPEARPRQTFMPNLSVSRQKRTNSLTQMDRLAQAEEQPMLLPSRVGQQHPHRQQQQQQLLPGSSQQRGTAAQRPGGGGSGGGGGSAGAGGAAGGSSSSAVKMDVDDNRSIPIPTARRDDSAAVAPRAASAQSDATSRAWLLEPDAPLQLPLRPFPDGYGDLHADTTSRSASRAASSRATSRGPSRAGTPARRFRPTSAARVVDDDDDDAGASASGADADGPKPLTFPPGSAARSLFKAGTASVPDAGEAEDGADAPAFLFFQLPTSLPLKAGASLDGADPTRHVMSGSEYLAALAGSGSVKAEAGASSTARGGAAPSVELCDLGGGQLGELVVRRSGKVALRIGSLCLDVDPGTTCSVDQDIVAMALPNEPGGDVSLHRLGKMPERMVVAPNLDNLLGGAF